MVRGLIDREIDDEIKTKMREQEIKDRLAQQKSPFQLNDQSNYSYEDGEDPFKAKEELRRTSGGGGFMPG